jgi:hypothetical protein
MSTGNHCSPCPTAQSAIHGHDPESYDLLHCPEWVAEEISNGSKLWCPWRQGWCVEYPAELARAAQCHSHGIPLGIAISKCYQEPTPCPK